MVREPLFHFLLFGLLIFAYFTALPTNDDSTSHEIVIGEAEIQRLKDSWEQSWRTPPNEQQMAALLDNAIKEEIYYREGVRLGLDKYDPVVRNRMVQKMRFLQPRHFRDLRCSNQIGFIGHQCLHLCWTFRFSRSWSFVGVGATRIMLLRVVFEMYLQISLNPASV